MKFKGRLIVPDAIDDTLIRAGQLHLAVEYYNLLSEAQKARLESAGRKDLLPPPLRDKIYGFAD